MTEAEPVVRLSGVGHRYGKVVALAGVDLELWPGELIGLIGPDGVGKSTLLSLIAGAKAKQTGEVRVLGGDMGDRRHRGAICARIAFMPQGLGRNLYADLTVRENIDFFGRLFQQDGAERARRLAALVESTGLAPFQDRAAKHLSGGMRQKLGLCCSLIHDPDLLILDEPTTGVDPLSRRQFWDLIDRMRAERPGMTVIVATAYMEEAERFDRVIALNDGVILATGTPAELMAQTGQSDLEESFVTLLPEAMKAGRIRVNIPPLVTDGQEPAIVAKGLTKRFDDFVAVDHIDLTIQKGEIFGFLGSNGCGKTTTMKMLTGRLPATEGGVWLFGKPIEAGDRAMRFRVGYMSQSFSLYGELTVQQNLDLHARLFQMPRDHAIKRIDELIEHFGLEAYRNEDAADLPLGIRQRLSLAVAVVHEPELLILDEPTSGVDPLARDLFWQLLGELSRNQGVTIFISTHFMNEAARCDRISLMHAGRLLATGTPAELVAARGAPDLETTFIAYLSEQPGNEPLIEQPSPAETVPEPVRAKPSRFSLQRMLAYTRRETLELRRDTIRLGFALLGTAFLMLVFGYGINTDVDHLAFAALDHDGTPESHGYIDEVRGSSYFAERPPLASYAEMEARLASGELMVAIEIPSGFGRDLRRGHATEIGAWIDGAMPFRAETTKGYLLGTHQLFLQKLAALQGQAVPTQATIETRFRYNQDFKSARAMVPSTIAMLLALIPAILMALAVVREKEIGTITNLYVTPVTKLEFIIGKQLPYVGLAMINFLVMATMAIVIFDVPLKGSFLTLALATLLYVVATTSYGLIISTFASTQIAALFGTAILTFMPTMQLSGMLAPVSTLSGMAAVMSQGFPMSHYLPISVGVFTKSLGFAELSGFMLKLAAFAPVLIGASCLILRKQER